jgi:hypothetical protein
MCVCVYVAAAQGYPMPGGDLIEPENNPRHVFGGRVVALQGVPMRLPVLRTAVSAAALFTAIAIAPAAMAGNGENLVQYVPQGTDAVVAVNVERLRSVSVFSDVTGLITGMSEYRETIGTLTSNGVTFDPMTDVNTVLVAIPNLNASPDSRDGVMIVEADFDTAQVIAAAQANSYTVQTAGSVQYFVARENTVAILAPGIAAVGDNDSVQSIINGSAGAGSGLRAQVRAADKGDTIWFAATGSVEGFSAAHGSINMASGFEASLTGTMASAEAASAMVTDLTAQRATLAADATVSALGLTGVVNGLTATSNDANVTFGLTLDSGTWSSLATRLLAVVESEL